MREPIPSAAFRSSSMSPTQSAADRTEVGPLQASTPGPVQTSAPKSTRSDYPSPRASRQPGGQPSDVGARCWSSRRVSRKCTGVLLAGLVTRSASRARWPVVGCGGRSRAISGGFAAVGVFQALRSWCWWSLSRLWVAAISRHSDLTADLPRRENRRKPRLLLICANTGSTVPWRLR